MTTETTRVVRCATGILVPAQWGDGASADNQAMIRTLGLASSVVLLTACSPALNWRDVALPQEAMSVSLPCKPEQAQRTVELAGQPVEMRMTGCEADGGTFAVACATLADPGLAGGALTHWRAAVLASMQAPAQGQPGAPQDRPFVPAGALDLPQSVRTVALGRQPDGSAVAAQAVWFARVRGAKVHACHAVLFSARPRPEVAEPFLAGLVLR